MNLSVRNRLEANGIMIMEVPFDFHYKTNTFVQLPDGRSLAYYDYLHQIPDTLSDGEEVSLGDCAIPAGEYIPTDDANGQGADGIIWDGDNPNVGLLGGSQGLAIPAAFIALIIFLIKIIAIFIILYLLISKVLVPCGGVEQTDVDQCMKVIQFPDCSTITINSCNKDENGNYVPDVVNRTDAPVDWIQWAIIGVVAVAGLLVVVQLAKRRGSSRNDDD